MLHRGRAVSAPAAAAGRAGGRGRRARPAPLPAGPGSPRGPRGCRIHRAVEDVVEDVLEDVSGAHAGATREEWAFALTSLPPDQAAAARREQLWRGHWPIENGRHDVRDVTLGEDACQVRMDRAPANLAAGRTVTLNLLRQHGVTTVAAALRRHAMYPRQALALRGI